MPGRHAGTRGAGCARNALVDSLRGIAAISVILYHVSFHFGTGTMLTPFLTQRDSGPPIPAVALFFVISGFVLYRPFVLARYEGRRAPQVLPYAVRRVARIVPAYWVALAVVSAWLGLRYMWHPANLIRYFGFLQLYGNSRASAGGLIVAWSLCVEVSFYAALPGLALAARRLGRGRSRLGSELGLLAMMALASLVWQALIAGGMPYQDGWQTALLLMLPGSLGLFAAGMLLAVLAVEGAHRERIAGGEHAIIGLLRRTGLCWSCGLGLLLLQGQISRGPGLTYWWMATATLKALACFLLLAPIVLGSERRGLVQRLLRARPLVWLGTVSYGVYLWQLPIVDKLDPGVFAHGEAVAVLTVAAITVALGAASYYLVELPSQGLAQRLLARRAARIPTAAPSLELDGAPASRSLVVQLVLDLLEARPAV